MAHTTSKSGVAERVFALVAAGFIGLAGCSKKEPEAEPAPPPAPVVDQEAVKLGEGAASAAEIHPDLTPRPVEVPPPGAQAASAPDGAASA